MTHTLQLNCVKSAIFYNFVKWKRKRRRKSAQGSRTLTHTKNTRTQAHSHFVTDLSRTSCAIYTNLFLLLVSFLFFCLLVLFRFVLMRQVRDSLNFRSLSLTHSVHALSLCLSRLNALNFGFALSTNKQIARKSHAHCTFNLIRGDFLLLHTLSIV